SMTAQVDAVLSAHGADGFFTHAEAAFGRLGEGLLCRNRWAGDTRSIFDLASLTKALVTTPLAFQASGGNLDLALGDLVSGKAALRLPDDVLPLSLKQILRHETGLA